MADFEAISVDREWVTSLKGLIMKVGDWWWPGYTTTTLRPGKIVHVNFTNDSGRFFVLQLDNESFTYPMWYDAVIKYTDKDDANYNIFCLPDGLLEDPADKEVADPCQRRCCDDS